MPYCKAPHTAYAKLMRSWPGFEAPEALTDRSDVIVLTDEAHRSQYDTLALNMRSALPKAMFMAFTGTRFHAASLSSS